MFADSSVAGDEAFRKANDPCSLDGGLIDGLHGERDRLLWSGREPDIGECDSKRVDEFPSGKEFPAVTANADRSDSSLRASRGVRPHCIANEAVVGSRQRLRGAVNDRIGIEP